VKVFGKGQKAASADLGAASQALGHSDLSTTASIYGHYDLSDLERAMEALARSRREDEEPAD
jgi:integrase